MASRRIRLALALIGLAALLAQIWIVSVPPSGPGYSAPSWLAPILFVLWLLTIVVRIALSRARPLGHPKHVSATMLLLAIVLPFSGIIVLGIASGSAHPNAELWDTALGLFVLTFLLQAVAVVLAVPDPPRTPSPAAAFIRRPIHWVAMPESRVRFSAVIHDTV